MNNPDVSPTGGFQGFGTCNPLKVTRMQSSHNFSSSYPPPSCLPGLVSSCGKTGPRFPILCTTPPPPPLALHRRATHCLGSPLALPGSSSKQSIKHGAHLGAQGPSRPSSVLRRWHLKMRATPLAAHLAGLCLWGTFICKHSKQVSMTRQPPPPPAVGFLATPLAGSFYCWMAWDGSPPACLKPQSTPSVSNWTMKKDEAIITGRQRDPAASQGHMCLAIPI